MTKRILVSFALALLLAMGWLPAQAARSFSATQTSPTPAPGQFDMGTTQSVTISVTNTSTGANVAERLYQVQFQLSTTACSPTPCTNTVFSSATTAPAGWTRTSFSSTSITFKANTFADAIGSTTANSFTLVLAVGAFTADLSQTLSKVTARFSANTNFGGSHAVNCTSGTCLGSWKAMSLQITKFQTQTTAGVDTNAVAAGQSFLIVITMKNISTAAQNGIVAISSPPSVITRTGTWFGTSPVCSLTGTSPSPLNLAAGASGTITYTCTTHVAPANPTDSGTVTYSVTKVQTGPNTATSRTATSNTLSVSPLTAGIAITASAAPTACLFAGGNATFTMTVTNNTGGTVTGVSPTLNAPTVANGASIGVVTGPTLVAASSDPGCSSTLPNTKSCVYTWTATASVTGSYPSSPPQPSFYTTGFASATSSGSPITTPIADSRAPNPTNILEYVVSVSPVAIYASSTNVELDWNLANLGCPTANVSSVAVTVVPPNWTLSPDPAYAYSLVTDTTSSANDTWTVSGTTFTAPNASSQILVYKLDNDFYLLFSATPSTLGTSTFTVVVTDTNGVSRTQTTPVTVNALTPGSVTPWTWREIFQ